MKPFKQKSVFFLLVVQEYVTNKHLTIDRAAHAQVSEYKISSRGGPLEFSKSALFIVYLYLPKLYKLKLAVKTKG